MTVTPSGQTNCTVALISSQQLYTVRSPTTLNLSAKAYIVVKTFGLHPGDMDYSNDLENLNWQGTQYTI